MIKRGTMVWLDCEMTGLNPFTDRILEIAILVTTDDLEVLAKPLELVITCEQSILDQMDEWCTSHHTDSGLVQRVIESKISTEMAQSLVCNYILECKHRKRACQKMEPSDY
ncbi:Oligoribonuclease [Smittium mucronatum]|uniref:Oligoribonuclease n=1 Tax=Smittium mucronatum TaxID=133383 RepID=A0A1R0GM23_9FUNG|nr:Oligoribonuclease [Smittium mucronatum]